MDENKKEATETIETTIEAAQTALLEIDVQVDTRVLYDYMLYHMYHGMAGILGTMVGLFLVAYYIGYGGSLLYLIGGIVVILYLPVSLYMTAKKQALTNPAFKEPLHYAFTEEGIEVSQGDAHDSMKWSGMQKAVSTGKSIILYTSKVNASIFPRKACGDQVINLISIIATHMPPQKVKIRQ